MMALFQKKIIYMLGLPPIARRRFTRIEGRNDQIWGWDENQSLLGKCRDWLGCFARADSDYIIYFQGHVSFPLLIFMVSHIRLVIHLRCLLGSLFFPKFCACLERRHLEDNRHVLYTVICCSYRRYRSSKGRSSGKGIAQDATATLEWIKSANKHQVPCRSNDQQIPTIIWGENIDAGVATNLSAQTGPST